MKPIENAGNLYREIKKRGLHLRKENGRDNALLKELSAKLGCQQDRLQSFLDNSDLTAEEFLKVFLQVAEPFARMFEEIWQFLSEHFAPKAKETVAIRFGFPDSNERCSIDLEQFRRYVETEKRVLAPIKTRIWPFEALEGLFDVGRTLTPPRNHKMWRLYERQGPYNPGKPYQLPTVIVGSHPFDKIVQEVWSVFQQIIDEYALEQERPEKARHLPELSQQDEGAEARASLQGAASLLTDLLPTWFYILTKCSDFDDVSKDRAYRQYNSQIRELLQSGTSLAQVPLLEALDILDLPFWRHRWHTYEVWATVLTLRSLQDYKYKLNLRAENGYIPLDGYSPAIVADLGARDYSSACVAVQVETPFREGRRRSIKPDLRICFANPNSPDHTAGVVEFKQRWRISNKELTEMATAYAKGCPRSGGVLILNYDISGIPTSLPNNCHLLEGVQPLGKNAILTFKERLSKMLRDAHLEPAHEDTIVLLDVSSSMGDKYRNERVQHALRSLLRIPWVEILRFNNGLVQGGDLDPLSAQNLATSGGTELGRALSDIEHLFGVPSRLLIVTDGEHDHPTKMLRRVPHVRECSPSEIEENISWLR